MASMVRLSMGSVKMSAATRRAEAMMELRSATLLKGRVKTRSRFFARSLVRSMAMVRMVACRRAARVARSRMLWPI